MDIRFNTIQTGSNGSHAIIVLAEKNEEIMQLQMDICLAFSDYTNYVDPDTERHQKNFKPHIVISYSIPESEYQKSLEIVKDGCECEGAIHTVILSVIEQRTIEEAKNPANVTVFAL